jgi:sterol 14-demethylase
VSSLLLVLYASYAYFFSGNNTNKIPELGGLSIVNAWSFFNRRYDFLRSNFDKIGHELFSFKILQVSPYLGSQLLSIEHMISQYKIVAMSGKEARDTFFHEKTLSLHQGHEFLTGGVSQILESHGPLLNLVLFAESNVEKYGRA